MARPTLEELRARVDPEGYLSGLRDVLANYKQQLTRQLVEYDTVDAQEGIDDRSRKEVLASLRKAMEVSAERVEIIDAKIAGFTKPSRAERRREEKKSTKAVTKAVKKKAKKKR